MRWWPWLVLIALSLPVLAETVQPPPKVDVHSSPEDYTRLTITDWDASHGWAGVFQSEQDGGDLVLRHLDSGREETLVEDVFDGPDSKTVGIASVLLSTGLVLIEEGVSGNTEPASIWQAERQDSGEWLYTPVYDFHDGPSTHPALDPPPRYNDWTQVVAGPPGPAFAIQDHKSDGSETLVLKLATYDDQWSFEVIDEFSWHAPLDTMRLLRGPDGSLHVVAMQVDDQTWERTFVHFRQEAGGWSRHENPFFHSIGYVSGHQDEQWPLQIVLLDQEASQDMVPFLYEYDGQNWARGHEFGPYDYVGTPRLAHGPGGRLATEFHHSTSDGSETSILVRSGTAWDEWRPASESSRVEWTHTVHLQTVRVDFNPIVLTIEANSVGGGPLASLSMPDEATTRQEILFESVSWAPTGSTIESHDWQIAGAPPSGPSTTAGIEQPGRHWISLTVTDGNGRTDTATAPIDITRIGPEACIDAPSTGTTGEPVSFQDCSSHPESDLGATIESFAWEFGDGDTSPQQSPGHAYASPGTYDVKLTVTDEQGATDEATHSITVSDPPPNQKPEVSVSVEPEEPFVGQEVAFLATASDPDGSVASTAWKVEGTDAGSGTSLTRTFTEAGSVSVKFTATDDDGESSSVTKNVVVQAPVAPELSLSQTQLSETAGQELNVTVTVENPNPVNITVDLASDAPEAWNASFSPATLELDADASQDVTFSITPPYFEGGLTIIELQATVGEEAETALLRVQLQPGQAPQEEDNDSDPSEEEEDETDDEDGTASVQQSTDSKNEGVPTWVWFAGGGALAFAGVGVGVVLLLRRT